MSLPGNCSCWSIASLCFTLLWFKLIRPLMRDRTKAGHLQGSVIGEVGHVTRVPAVRNEHGALCHSPAGADEWPFICA